MNSKIIAQRNSSYELLRLISGLAVIVLHFNFFPSGGGALNEAQGLIYYVLLLLEIISVSAVNNFILLSGYFSCDSHTIKTGRLLELLLQTVCFSLVFELVKCFLYKDWDLNRLLISLLPVNYFVVLYIVMMVLAPFINKLICSIGTSSFNLLVILSFLIFSVYATIVDILIEYTNMSFEGLSSVGLKGSMNGYSIVNFLLVYIIGTWLKKNENIKTIKTVTLIIWWILSILMICIWRILLPQTAWTYCNPIIILNACIDFILFGRIRINSKVINSLARASFVSFLINVELLGFIGNQLFTEKSPLLIILLLAIIFIYGISYFLMLIWNLITKPIFKYTINKLPNFTVW